MAANRLYKTYASGTGNSILCSGTNIKWFINKLPMNGSELPMYHPRHIGERNLLTNYAKKKALNR